MIWNSGKHTAHSTSRSKLCPECTQLWMTPLDDMFVAMFTLQHVVWFTTITRQWVTYMHVEYGCRICMNVATAQPGVCVCAPVIAHCWTMLFARATRPGFTHLFMLDIYGGRLHKQLGQEQRTYHFISYRTTYESVHAIGCSGKSYIVDTSHEFVQARVLICTCLLYTSDAADE